MVQQHRGTRSSVWQYLVRPGALPGFAVSRIRIGGVC